MECDALHHDCCARSKVRSLEGLIWVCGNSIFGRRLTMECKSTESFR
jgi:hypothetical protein